MAVADQSNDKRPIASRLLAFGISLLCIGTLLAGYAALEAAPMLRSLIFNPTHAVPGEFQQELDKGDYLISVQTASARSTGPIRVVERNSINVHDLSVSDPEGNEVFLSNGRNQTVDRSGNSFTGVAVFTVDRAGLYTFSVSTSAQTNALITHSITSFSLTALALGAAGFLTFPAGVILVIVGLTRLRSQRLLPPPPIPG